MCYKFKYVEDFHGSPWTDADELTLYSIKYHDGTVNEKDRIFTEM